MSSKRVVTQDEFQVRLAAVRQRREEQAKGDAKKELKLVKPLGQGFFSAVYLGDYGGKQVAVKPVNVFGHGPVPWAKGTEQVPTEHPTGLTGPEVRAKEFWWGDEVAMLRAAASKCPKHIVELIADLPLTALPADAMKAEQDKVAAGQGAFVEGCMKGMMGLPPNQGAIVQHVFFNAAAFAHLGASRLMVLGLAGKGHLAGCAETFGVAELAKAAGVSNPGGDVLAVRAAFVAEMAAQVAEAVAACHSSGFLHMDVHLQNVLVGDDDCARLTDFGCTRTLSSLPKEIRAEAEARKMAYKTGDFKRWTLWDDEALATVVRRLWDPTVKDRMFPGTMYPASQVGVALLGFHARDSGEKKAFAAAPEAGAALPASLQAVVGALMCGVRSEVQDGEDSKALIDGVTAGWGFRELPAPPAPGAPPAPAGWGGSVDGAALEKGMAEYLAAVTARVAAAAAALRAAAAELKAKAAAP